MKTILLWVDEVGGDERDVAAGVVAEAEVCGEGHVCFFLK